METRFRVQKSMTAAKYTKILHNLLQKFFIVIKLFIVLYHYWYLSIIGYCKLLENKEI